jgi:hypothetical protein
MKEKIIGAAVALAVLGAGLVAHRAGWLPTSGPGSAPVGHGGAIAGGVGGGVTGGVKVGGSVAAAPGGTGDAAGGTAIVWGLKGTATIAPVLAPGGNLATLDLDAHIESATSDYGGSWSARGILDGTADGAWSSQTNAYPQDIVVSFFERQAVLISAFAARPGHKGYEDQFAREVEIWVSTTSPTAGFTKIGGLTFEKKADEQGFAFEPVEARFVRIRILSNHGHTRYVQLGGVRITEAQRPGYASLLTRNAALATWVGGQFPAAPPTPGALAAGVPSAGGGCAPLPVTVGQTATPRVPESRRVLVVADTAGHYAPTRYNPSPTRDFDLSLYGRITFTVVPPQQARPAAFAATDAFDTVVLSQLCSIGSNLSESFKKALVAWVGQGHKLIIQDSDDCGGVPGPDYSFLPYPFATSNPGAQGAKGDTLFFVEENTLGNAREGDPGLIVLDHWTKWPGNEIGDSNTIYKYDAHWCGHLFGTNVKRVNGFMQAYAHYGRGLIVYDGFDNDQSSWDDYQQLVTRQLAQGFDPDGLPCTATLGDFVITTEPRLKTLPMVPGRTYTYPMTLFSNQGYKGTVGLALTTTPADPGLAGSFESASVPLEEISHSTLTVTAARTASSGPHSLTVRGTDASGKNNVMCLQLVERTTGGIQVVGELTRDRKPTKNLEIILDASGSMKEALGRKTRWATALDVLERVLQKLPDDFNVGLRLYGHRESSRSPKTCTDSELLVAIKKLDRSGILNAARGWKPKGETPLVYSVLQTPADLKDVGGGAVILITDGEESCQGDVKAAVTAIHGSNLAVAVNIIGFTLTGRQTQAQLTTLAEGTGGHYYAAQSGEALARALLIAAVEKFPYVISDAAGKVVVKGDAGGPPEELPEGDYTVVVTAGDQQLKEKVAVAAANDVVLRVRLKGDRFVIER